MTPDAEIVPRWEWRTFGADLDAAARRLREGGPGRTRESDEVYVLGINADRSAKFRDGVIDVKRLERVDENGLELWLPVARAALPVSAEDAGRLLVALGAEVPELRRDAYTLDALVEELVAPSPQLRALAVHKERTHYTFEGCMAEVTRMRTDEGAVDSLAVESEDPSRVLAAVRALGLASRPNVNVPRGLGALVGFGARRYAVVDVGTNSVKFYLAERGLDRRWRTIADRSEVTRLGEGLAETGRLQREAIARTVGAIAAMAAEAEQAGAAAVAVGTAWMRTAVNTAEIVCAVRGTGLKLDVVSGEEEARLAYRAALDTADVADRTVAVFDTGGGSSQFTFGRGDEVHERFSVEVGAARFTDRFALDGPVSEAVLADAQAAIAHDLERLAGRPTPDVVLGMGGAVTNLAAVRLGLRTYDPDRIRGSVLERAEIDRQIDLYRTRSAEERRDIVGLQPKRAEVILAGACIVRAILERLGADSLTVSDRGLRHRLLVERFR